MLWLGKKPKYVVYLVRKIGDNYIVLKKKKVNKSEVKLGDGKTATLIIDKPSFVEKNKNVYVIDVDRGEQLNFKVKFKNPIDVEVTDLILSKNIIKNIVQGLQPYDLTYMLIFTVLGIVIGVSIGYVMGWVYPPQGG